MKVMAITLNSRLFPPNPCRSSYTTTGLLQRKTIGNQWWGVVHYSSTSCRHNLARNSNLVVLATGGSSSDDYLPFDMSVENALEILGVNKGSSFDDILNAKNSILASSQNDPEMVEQRCAGKVVNNSIRYADVQTVNGPDMSSTPQSLQATLKRIPVSVEAPSANNLGIHAGVYGALMGLTYINGASVSSGEPYAGADIPGLILAAGFGASIYLLTKKNNSPRMSTVITIGGLVVGATMGSAVEDWLQVDIIPFLGIHSPAVVVSEFILFSQFLVSLYVK
ncbi:uncharacterized protein LOC113291377 isoform X2 [Papaver somniferum]|uniref:uncharacterized protein LOC113291377 isoform X2 n=1 Tax=Papaver somniferum TaxID=3469 RepID=UPI000E701A3B|nr:uncharacterized protein LOC113291377 isoform X2 [Papaver somniferum]